MTWVVVGGWLAGWVLLWRLPRLGPPAPAPAEGRRVSVVIPARNEADRLPTLLAGLARQSRPADQVVVVDDGSSDGTAAAARAAPGVDVVTATAVPSGWNGKAWACAGGVRATEGDVLVFLDADVELDGEALASLLTTWEARGGLVSVQPHHHIRRPIEALSLPFNVVAVMGLGIGSLLPPRHEWGAAGPCIVTSRADYARVGGHAAAPGAVAEDLALAQRYVDAGLEVRCVGGAPSIRFRMYRDLHGIVEGWSKNLVAGAHRTPVVRALGIGLWVTAVLAIAVRLAAGPAEVPGGLAGGVGLYGAVAGQTWLLGRSVGRFGAAALLWPALFAFFVAVSALSAVRATVLRRVRWSGRTLAITGRR
ncbi:MAG: glycosyltransferase [Acidimicrobiales bacterium]|nr:glycosyltransferase [Acidimicrobiales bacterium]